MKPNLLQRMCEMTWYILQHLSAHITFHSVAVKKIVLFKLYWLTITFPVYLKACYCLNAHLQVLGFTTVLIESLFRYTVYSGYILRLQRRSHVNNYIMCVSINLRVEIFFKRAHKCHLLNNICFYSKLSSLLFPLYSQSIDMEQRASRT